MLDVTQATETVPDSESVAVREALDVLNIGLAVFDRDLRLLTCNRAYVTLLSLPPHLCGAGTSLEAIFHFKADRGDYGAVDGKAIVTERLALAQRFEAHSYKRTCPDGTVFKVEGHPIPSGGFVTTYTDITRITRAYEALEDKEVELRRHLNDMEMERDIADQQAQHVVEIAENLAMQKKEIEANLKQTDFEARHDPLTGLPNRRFFLDHLRSTFAKAEYLGTSMAVLFIDLDNFKPVNDTLGHDRGDQVLWDVAHALRQSVRDSDFVARLGGDEFAVLAGMKPENGSRGVRVLADRIGAALSIDVEAAAGRIPITASIGVSIFPEDSADLGHCLAKADKAMYAAKTAGRNCVVFAAELPERKNGGIHQAD